MVEDTRSKKVEGEPREVPELPPGVAEVDPFSTLDDIIENLSDDEQEPETPQEASNNPSDGTTDSNKIRVVVRMRPLLPDELARGEIEGLRVCDDNQTIEFLTQCSKSSQFKTLTFHSCVAQDLSQEDVFPLSGIDPLIAAVCKGQNATALAYGQTGSGKTYTMSGPENLIGANPNDMLNDPQGLIPKSVKNVCTSMCEKQARLQGLMPRCIRALFREIKKQGVPTSVKVSFLEIYNEKISDLLSGKDDCAVRMHQKEGFYVEDALLVPCKNARQLMAAYVKGMRNRAVSATMMNKESSRSHSIIQIFVERKTGDAVVSSKLVLVDLAGSERMKTHGTDVVRRNMLETANINKSLLALSNVVSKLSSGESSVNYRDSNLTKLLMDTLGGHGNTLVIACVSPAATYIEESLNTLTFASKAANIVKKVVVKLSPHELEIQQLQQTIAELRVENERLKSNPASTGPAPAQLICGKCSGDVLESEISEAPAQNPETEDLTVLQLQAENRELKEGLWSKVVMLEKVASGWKSEAMRLRAVLEENGITVVDEEPEPEVSKTDPHEKMSLAERIKMKKQLATDL
eukprot:c16167_g1_i2.p1 GENE.c16167_g1_i2~~c16167_g1_i2.p1  ORF type:complete len:577 (+),score=117.44 c16167_g1_i2:927-2657(+)